MNIRIPAISSSMNCCKI